MGRAPKPIARDRHVTVIIGDPLSPDPAELASLLGDIETSRRWTNGGPLATRLEQSIAATEGWKSVAATSSGTSALTVALLALNAPPGSEVVTTPLTFRASALAIEAAGLVPVFAAVDPQSLNLDASAVDSAIGPRTRAILAVHLFGLPVDSLIDEVASRRGIPVIYDAAHAFGLSTISGRGAATAYSLHATKLLHTGEGGALATDSEQLAERARRISNFGIDGAMDAGSGVNAKLSEIAAAVGLAMLNSIEGEKDARRRVRAAYENALASGGRASIHAPGRERALIIEPVRCQPEDQADLITDLAREGIFARTFPALCAPGQRYATTPIVGASRERIIELARTVVALPIHGRVRPDQAEAIGRVLRG